MMKTKRMVTWLMAAACSVWFGSVALADSGLGLFGAYWDTDEGDDAFGGGAKLKLGMEPFYFVARGTYFEDVLDDDTPANEELEAIPVDAGLELDWEIMDNVIVYLGGGGTYFFLDMDRADIDDEWGWYGEVGFEVRLSDHVSLFAEGLWREVEGTAEDDDLDDLTSDVDIDLSGFGANVGLLFR